MADGTWIKYYQRGQPPARQARTVWRSERTRIDSSRNQGQRVKHLGRAAAAGRTRIEIKIKIKFSTVAHLSTPQPRFGRGVTLDPQMQSTPSEGGGGPRYLFDPMNRTHKSDDTIAPCGLPT